MYPISLISKRCKPATYFSGQYGLFNARRDGFVSSRIHTHSVDSSDNPFETFRHVWRVRIERRGSEKTKATYYTFEVVKDAYISDEGLHLLIEIPLYMGHGVHGVLRATPIPQPIPQTKRATQYHLSKTHLLMSSDKTNFAEVTEQELSTHCWGSHRLKLCKQPFSTTKSQMTTF